MTSLNSTTNPLFVLSFPKVPPPCMAAHRGTSADADVSTQSRLCAKPPKQEKSISDWHILPKTRPAPGMTRRLVPTPNSHHSQHLDSPHPPIPHHLRIRSPILLHTRKLSPSLRKPLLDPTPLPVIPIPPNQVTPHPLFDLKRIKKPRLHLPRSRHIYHRDFVHPPPPTRTTPPVQSMPGSMSSICSGALPPLVRRVYKFSGSSTMTFAPCHTLSGSCMNMCPSGRRSQRLHSLSLLLSCRVTRGRWSSRSVNETARCLRLGRCSTRDGTLRSLSCSQAMPSVPRSWWGRP